MKDTKMILTAATCLAMNMFYEARNESTLGQLMVAEVTLNRVESNRYPDNVCDVVWQRKQFSWTHDGKSDNPDRLSYLDRQVWESIQDLAWDVITGTADVPSTGATMYHADYVSPYWINGYNEVAVVGTHIFYK